MSKSEIYRERAQKGERPSQDIMTPFELIKPCDYDSVITELQKENINLGAENDKLDGLNMALDLENKELQNSRKELKDENTRLLVLAIKHCPIEHHDFNELKKISVK